MTENGIPKGARSKVSRRGLLGAAGLLSAGLPIAAIGQQQPVPAAPGAPAARPARPPPQGGRGPIKVLFISGYHEFDREDLFLTLDSMGQDITWTHVEHPAAAEFYSPKLAAPYDVLLFYDCYAGRVTGPPTTPGGRPSSVDHVPTKEMQANLKALMQSGQKGFVFTHHSIASWVHTWPAGANGFNAYSEVIGGAADWTRPLKNVRGVDYPPSGYMEGVPINIEVVDPTHPIMQGVEPKFEIIDEKYLCAMFEDSVHCLTRSTHIPKAEDFRPGQVGHPVGSNMTSWVKTAERSPVAYIQHGHDNRAWSNPNYRKMLLNAIKWAASPESKTWAKANAKRIFA